MMKFTIQVEVMEGDKPLDPATLCGCRTGKFPRAAPKLFRRAIRSACWPFDAKVKVEIQEQQEQTQPKPKKKKKGKK